MRNKNKSKNELVKAIIDAYQPETAKDVQDALKDIFGPMFEAMLQGEMNSHLGYKNNNKGEKQTQNRRNGYISKNVKTSMGEMTIDVPRDRDGSFEPQIVPKRTKDISDIDKKVLSMYAKGMSQRDIPKTEKGIRGIPIPMFCVEAIKDCIKYRETEVKLIKEKYGKDTKIVPNLFLGKMGGYMFPDTLSHNWTKFKNKNKEELKKIIGNKNITLHGLRHSYCTYMRIEGKFADKEIMDLMGHTAIKTTDGYTHSNREIGDKVIEMWDDFTL